MNLGNQSVGFLFPLVSDHRDFARIKAHEIIEFKNFLLARRPAFDFPLKPFHHFLPGNGRIGWHTCPIDDAFLWQVFLGIQFLE